MGELGRFRPALLPVSMETRTPGAGVMEEEPGSEPGAGGGGGGGAGEEAAPPLLEMPAAVAVELPPCHGHPGPVLTELPAEREPPPPPPPRPPELPPTVPPSRGHCLLRNWQEERATNGLDQVPGGGGGGSSASGPSEGFFYRHGHRGLLTLQWLAGLASSTTMKDAYRRPWRTALPERGPREAMTEWLLYQKYSKEVFEEDVDPPRSPMESLSTTHRDYRQGGFLSAPPAPSQPHHYQTEQPQTFWLEHARQLPGVSHIGMGEAPFKKNASFTTPVTEELDQPLPYGPENYPKL